MAQSNYRKSPREYAADKLESVLFAHMLHEDTFYLNGTLNRNALQYAVRAATLTDPSGTRAKILKARTEMNIRHASLLAAVEYARSSNGGPEAIQLITDVIQRVDELAEVCAIAAAHGTAGVPDKAVGLSSAVRKGVSRAFGKFDEYQFGKYKGQGRAISLRDTVFLTHPSPAKYPLVQKIVDGTLAVPNTWETRLSGGEDACQVFTELLSENKLGAMALLRNLRNMQEAGVDRALVRAAMNRAEWSRVLPFRFMTALVAAPTFASAIDRSFQRAVRGSTYLSGKTAVMVDTSGSMQTSLSSKSAVKLYQAGAVLGAAVNGDHVDLFEWASRTRQVPAFQSLASAMSLGCGTVGNGTDLRQAMDFVGNTYDRYIVLSDMRLSNMRMPLLPRGAKGFIVDISPYHGSDLNTGQWDCITGWSDQILRYIGGRG